MKVALISTMNERCGIAEYAKNLIDSMCLMAPEVEFRIFERPWQDLTRGALEDCDIIHLNYEPGLFGFIGTDSVNSWRANGKKTVLTLHTSHEGNNRNDFTAAFDKVVVHEKTSDGFVHIPHGIKSLSPEQAASVEVTPSLIGTAGFPFPWKGFDVVAATAKELGTGCRVIAPESKHWDTWAVKKYLQELNPATEVITDWLPDVEVEKKLAECACTMFAYSGSNSGISGAVRLGLGSRRPTVLSRMRQFKDLYEYEDEITFCDTFTVSSFAASVQKAISTTGPSRVLDEMSWLNSAYKYLQVYRS